MFKFRRSRVWQRPRFAPGGDDAQLDFYLFSRGKWEPEEFAAALGASGWKTGAHLDSTGRDAEMLALLGLGSKHLSLSPTLCAELELVPFCNSFHATIEDPADLSYLQAAWKLVRRSVDCGTIAVLDGQSLNWFSIEDVCAWSDSDPLVPDRELKFVIETDVDDDGRVLANSRGLAKFGRRDLVIPALDPTHGKAAAYALSGIARMLMEGVRLSVPGRIAIGDAPPLYVADYPTFVPGFDAESGDPPVEHGLQLCDCDAEGHPGAGLPRLAEWLSLRA